jgi:hypothetical protein
MIPLNKKIFISKQSKNISKTSQGAHIEDELLLNYAAANPQTSQFPFPPHFKTSFHDSLFTVVT